MEVRVAGTLAEQKDVPYVQNIKDLREASILHLPQA